MVTLSGKAIVSKMQLFNNANHISYHGQLNECGSLEALHTWPRQRHGRHVKRLGLPWCVGNVGGVQAV